MWPAFTAQRLSWLFIYLSGDGTDIILTVSGLLVSFKHYWQRRYQKKKKILDRNMFVNFTEVQGKWRHPKLWKQGRRHAFTLMWAEQLGQMTHGTTGRNG